MPFTVDLVDVCSVCYNELSTFRRHYWPLARWPNDNDYQDNRGERQFTGLIWLWNWHVFHRREVRGFCIEKRRGSFGIFYSSNRKIDIETLFFPLEIIKKKNLMYFGYNFIHSVKWFNLFVGWLKTKNKRVE